jgi:hypothetical protein
MRAHAQYELYFLDPVSMQLAHSGEYFFNPGGLAWSPAGGRLALTARLGPFGTDGIWTYRPSSEKLSIVTEGTFSGFAWSPSGEQIVALRCQEAGCLSSSIQIVTPGR